jgi:hypothetical protein
MTTDGEIDTSVLAHLTDAERAALAEPEDEPGEAPLASEPEPEPEPESAAGPAEPAPILRAPPWTAMRSRGSRRSRTSCRRNTTTATSRRANIRRG